MLVECGSCGVDVAACVAVQPVEGLAIAHLAGGGVTDGLVQLVAVAARKDAE